MPGPPSVFGPQLVLRFWLHSVSSAKRDILVQKVACIEPALWRSAHTVTPSAQTQSFKNNTGQNNIIYEEELG